MPFVKAQLSLVRPDPNRIGHSTWVYDTTDAAGDVDATDYFAGQAAAGMEVGDLIILRTWASAVPTTTAGKNAATLSAYRLMVVIAVDSDGNCTVGQGTAITLTAGT